MVFKEALFKRKPILSRGRERGVITVTPCGLEYVDPGSWGWNATANTLEKEPLGECRAITFIFDLCNHMMYGIWVAIRLNIEWGLVKEGYFVLHLLQETSLGCWLSLKWDAFSVNGRCENKIL